MQTRQFFPKIIAALLVISAAIATLVPYAWTRINTGDAWRNITPQLSYDAMYYYARANDVTRGNFFTKNVYFIEHRDQPAPNFSMNDNIVALPQILGLSFNVGYYANIFLWALAFLSLLYALFREHSLSPTLGFLGALWCYVGLYGDMLRPGTMQTIYPLYILFLLFFWRYIKKNEGSMIPLALVVGITAYFYIFLFMTVAATLGVYFLAMLWSRNWSDLRRTALLGVIAIGVALPHIVRTFSLASGEFYAETLARISLSYSHWPQIEAYYYGRWVLLVLFLVYLIRRYYPDGLTSVTHFFVTATGIGILLAMVSNIFTGRDFEIAVHVARFGILWYLAVGIIIVKPVYAFLVRTKGAWPKRALIGLLSALLFYQMLANLERYIPDFGAMRGKFIEVQTYSGIVDWLKERPEGVVVAPEDLNSYISTLTKHYVLYNPYGVNFSVSDAEVRERYMLAHAFDRLTADEFIGRHSEYYGPAPSYLAKTSTLKHRLCAIFRDPEDCPAPIPERAFLDTETMKDEFEAYYPGLAADIEREYAKYHVRYIVSKTSDPQPLQGGSSCPVVYEDEWFTACAVDPM